jgi:hypothetical protein
MNTISMEGRLVSPGEMERWGDFCFSNPGRVYFYICIWLPMESGPDALRIQKASPGGPRVWEWDGNIEKPTLTPSIHALGLWHGYLKAGRFVSC